MENKLLQLLIRTSKAFDGLLVDPDTIDLEMRELLLELDLVICKIEVMLLKNKCNRLGIDYEKNS